MDQQGGAHDLTGPSWHLRSGAEIYTRTVAIDAAGNVRFTGPPAAQVLFDRLPLDLSAARQVGSSPPSRPPVVLRTGAVPTR